MIGGGGGHDPAPLFLRLYPGHSLIFNIARFCVRATLKNREWPGDEARIQAIRMYSDVYCIIDEFYHTINPVAPAILLLHLATITGTQGLIQVKL